MPVPSKRAPSRSRRCFAAKAGQKQPFERFQFFDSLRALVRGIFRAVPGGPIRQRPAGFEPLEARAMLAASPWHNPFDSFQLTADSGTDDGSVALGDLVKLINLVATNDGRPIAVPELPSPDQSASPYYDVDDNWVVDRYDVTELAKHLAQSLEEPAPPGPPGRSAGTCSRPKGKGNRAPAGRQSRRCISRPMRRT